MREKDNKNVNEVMNIKVAEDNGNISIKFDFSNPPFVNDDPMFYMAVATKALLNYVVGLSDKDIIEKVGREKLELLRTDNYYSFQEYLQHMLKEDSLIYTKKDFIDEDEVDEENQRTKVGNTSCGNA